MTIVKSTEMTGSYSRFSFASASGEVKRYYAMLKEIGKAIIDDEFVYAQDTLLTFIRRAIKDMVGDGSPNTGFQVVGTSAVNDFTIKGGGGTVDNAGSVYVAGLRLILPSDILYSTQENAQAVLAPPNSGTRLDVVYLDVWMGEVSNATDNTIADPTLGSETSRRLKLNYKVAVAPGGSGLPAAQYNDGNGQPHYTMTLATILRTVSTQITAGMVTDLRGSVAVATLIGNAVSGHNADLAAHYAATTAQRGFVVLASQSDVATGTDAAKAVTPLALQAIAAGLIPVGGSMIYNGSDLPANFLPEDGAAVSRSTYAALFAKIGITYGSGNGSTTFNVPDSRGRSRIGTGTGSGLSTRALGASGGEESHLLSAAEVPTHDHFIANTDDAGNSTTSPTLSPANTLARQSSTSFSGVPNYGLGGTTTAGTVGKTTPFGAGGQHNNMAPFLVAQMLIRYQ